MTQLQSYQRILETSERITWQVEDLIGPSRRLDFTKPFLPESLARVQSLPFLTADEQRLQNQIRGHGYLYTFGLVEEFILPFVLDHARPRLEGDDYRARALLSFAAEEAKHIQLFRAFREEFEAGFGSPCEVIGPPQQIARAVLSHHPLAVALITLHIEWMTQRHYVESIRDDAELDPQFKSLLKHHWMEEAQHAQLDTLMVESLARECSPEEVARAIDEYVQIGGLFDEGMASQARLDLASFTRATGRELTPQQRERYISVQHQALRWTFIGSGMTHPRFVATLRSLDAAAAAQVTRLSPAFC